MTLADQIAAELRAVAEYIVQQYDIDIAEETDECTERILAIPSLARALAITEAVDNELDDLVERLLSKSETLQGMAYEAAAVDDNRIEHRRLRGKVEGVELALSFVKESVARLRAITGEPT